MKRFVARLYWMIKSEGAKSTPYLSTILLIGLLVVMHLTAILLVFNIPASIFRPVGLENKKLSNWANTILTFTPILPCCP